MTRRARWTPRGWAIAGALLVCGCSSSPVASPEAVAPGLRNDKPRADAFVGNIQSVETWSFADRPGRVIRTDNYRVFTTERDAVITERLPRFLELALTHYRSALGPLPRPSMRLDTYMMDNRPQWERVTRQLMGARAEAYLRIRRGGYATRGAAVLYDIGTFDTLSIAAHEGWHQYTQRTFRDPLPVWLEEGVATYMEGHKWAGSEPVFLPWANVERFDHLRTAQAAGSLLSLDRLFELRPEEQLADPSGDPLAFYSQIWALVHFLNEGAGGKHREALRGLLSDAADGRLRRVLLTRLDRDDAQRAISSRRGPGVFVAYFGDLDEADREYRAFVARLVSAGSRGAVVSGRSPMTRAGRTHSP